MIKSIPLLVLLLTTGCAPDLIFPGGTPVEDGGIVADQPMSTSETSTTPDVPATTELGVPEDSGSPADTGPTLEDRPVADAGTSDSGPVDTGTVADVGPPPVDAPDAGPVDTGSVDTAIDVPAVDVPADAGPPPVDVGTDRGPADTGPADTGAPEVSTDTGPSCPSARTLCSPGCMDLSSDPRNCGACGRVCSLPGAVPTCSLSRCDIGTCLPGYANCDGVSSTGCEIDLRQDPQNCGACGNHCQAPTGGTVTCTAGMCMPDCGPGNALVGTRCVPQVSCPDSEAPGCGIVQILGGNLTLGDIGAANAFPLQEQVRVTGFLMDRAEVTVARFRRFWTTTSHEGATLPGTASNCTWGTTPGSRENHPLNCVNHQTAAAFCRWEGGDLPTEAQWELAARGTMGRGYPWGSAFSAGTGCWSRSGACVVGAFPTGNTPDGLVDMAGNVMEWMRDRYAPYTDPFCWGGLNRDGDSPCLNNTLGQWSVRGGSWGSPTPSYDMRAASRSGMAQTGAAAGVGFRCVRAL